MSTQPQVNRIKVANPPLEDEVRTYLTADVAASATTITTLDNDGFVITGTADYYVLISNYGNEKAEIVLVDANGAGTSNTGFTISATKYTHETSDPVTFMRYNQIKIYGATASGGSKVLIATKDIDVSQQFTEYVYEGDTYSYFYTAYYNSTDDELSAYSDEISTTSFTRKSIQRIIDAGLRKALTQIDPGINGKLTWDTCVEIVQDGIDEILAVKRKWPFLRTIDSSTTTTTNQQYISKPSDLAFLEFLIIDDVEQQPMTRRQYNAYTASGGTVSTGKPLTFIEKNNKYYLYPTPNDSYTVIFEYYKVPATITSDLSTEIDYAFVPCLIHYCAANFAWIRGNDVRGDKMYSLFNKLLDAQVVEYSGPEQSGFAEDVDRTSPYDEEETLHNSFVG